MRRVSLIIVIDVQRLVYETNSIELLPDMLFCFVYVEFSELSFPAYPEPAKTPHFIELLWLGKAIKTFQPMHRETSFAFTQAKGGTIDFTTINQGWFGVANNMAVAWQVVASHLFSNNEISKARTCFFNPSSVSIPATRETFIAPGRRVKITYSPNWSPRN